MKVSVSLPDDDVVYLDDFARRTTLESRSAAVHRAIQLLRASEMGDAYAAAWHEWEESGDAEMWEATAADGLAP